ncbi:MAG: DUF599 family protein [Proteobacteria bacterium]|nr:DUF599 family protein [Pseudomonadota bacterium]MBI3496314.1 DUF599 family protein [Pseudomonadota bacterium]
MTRALTSFNGGLRAYYFALAAIGWFVHPALSILATTVMLAVLMLRQHGSRAARSIKQLADTLEGDKAPPR